MFCPVFIRANVLALAFAVGVGACTTDPPPALDRAAETAALRAVLDQQVRAWNAGDLEGFMAGYAQTDSLRFASGGTVRHGWQATLDGYRRGYPDRAAMGTLSFSDLDVQLLGPEHAYVFGRWHLSREAPADDAGGLFTLVFAQRAGQWRIVHDHTSAAAAAP